MYTKEELRKQGQTVVLLADTIARESQDDFFELRAAEMNFNTMEAERIDQELQRKTAELEHQLEIMKNILKKIKSL